ncbi:MAG TPA: alpha-amylase family glycosyl hydrolase [Opitutales bacterium]|nr:alpha-amylase family glycosyl hydrolase [Opitutales bacterium]
MKDCPKIEHVHLTSLTSGLVELSRDWHEDRMPPLQIQPEGKLRSLKKVAPYLFGIESGYYFENGTIRFLLDPAHYPWLGAYEGRLLVGGEFNDWNPLAEAERWELKETRIGDRVVLAASFPDDPVFSAGRKEFKFMATPNRWLSPPDFAPNRVGNELWNTNLEIDPIRTGHHRFCFETEEPVDLAQELFISWKTGNQEKILVRPGEFFFEMGSDQPMGAIVEKNQTVFRVFAPRARKVEVIFFEELSDVEEPQRLRLRRNGDGSWEGTVSKNLHGWFYWYFLEGSANESLHFWPAFPVADPWALALAGREGPGIVVDRTKLERAKSFEVPAWEDLVIAEVHVRDAVAKAPIALSGDERLGFTGLRKWVESEEFHLEKLGVNAVELQPVQEFDSENREEYHWGYMPVNFFAPESTYALYPDKASQLKEFQDLVAAFHKRGMAVILDVVYNHVGVPNNLLFIDREYYFELDVDGQLLNWSGCGNDVRADAAMSRRLIVESLVHLVEIFGVDGFRFDLAELLGVETLREIERRLKEIKPDVILIAEPWSFRGHIVRQLRSTGFASWNDAYRDFLRKFVRGHGDWGGIEFFLTGSPGDLAVWPAQTVNYVESHDDRTWIDNITENADFNGFFPTENDRRRTHLMVAFLMSSIGIPMIAAGQDFLRSKHGVNNTYQRGDLNALDYNRLEHFRGTHEYFADWIRFRRSERGRFFRLREHPTRTYFHFYFAERATAFAVIFNADRSQGESRLLLVINPHDHDLSIATDGISAGEWKRLANVEKFASEGSSEETWQGGTALGLDRLDCGLWEQKGG